MEVLSQPINRQSSAKRTKRIRINILFSFIFKFGSIGANFLIVPLAIKYLDATNYGVWLTLSSIVGWITYFDVGLGNGLRNKFAEAISKGENDKAKIYVSTTYFILGGIILSTIVIFLIINHWVDWNSILNTDFDKKILQAIALIVITSFCIRLVLDLISIIVIADQKPAISSLFNFLSSVLTLVAIFILTQTGNSSLLSFSLWYSVIPVGILIIANLVLFSNKYSSVRPSLGFVNIKYFKELFGLGIKFFLLQMIVLVIFSTDNLIISQLFGPAAVTPFNIAFKYFSIITMAFAIVVIPFWSAFTEAYTNNDRKWIRGNIRKLIYIWMLFSFSAVIMLLLSSWVYSEWIGKSINIPFIISLGMTLFVIISCWNNIFTFFINGVSKLKLQLIIGIFIGIINIPIAILFAKTTNLGSASVVFANCCCLLFGAILTPIQSLKILNGTAKGIWNK
ncbi:MAG: polysaccharide biosynthesis protein [Chitinophagaceae bacterium]|nr:MAG: polysaccharide biosynthesis protein [Chitinophagaceae bacterium]